jgi:formylglycine-generating enzyme
LQENRDHYRELRLLALEAKSELVVAAITLIVAHIRSIANERKSVCIAARRIRNQAGNTEKSEARMERFVAVLFGLLCLLSANFCQADTFGSGANAFDIDFVTIGNPGNAPDTVGTPSLAGSVPYTYQIGKYEISEQMIDDANALGGLGITKDTRGPNKPATSISWFEAAKFVNWLNTSSGYSPAYKFDATGNFQLWQPSDPGYVPGSMFRNSLAKYVLPSVDEWYKAAYYDPVTGVYFHYPTGSNIAPTPVASGIAPATAVYGGLLAPADITQAGGLSPYGTMAQGGNVWEWNETVSDAEFMNTPNLGGRAFRGGSYASLHDLESAGIGGSNPSVEFIDVGFRVGSVVPEPSTIVLCGTGLSVAFGIILRKALKRRS